MLAMDVNDNAYCLDVPGACSFFVGTPPGASLHLQENEQIGTRQSSDQNLSPLRARRLFLLPCKSDKRRAESRLASPMSPAPVEVIADWGPVIPWGWSWSWSWSWSWFECGWE